MNIRYCGNGFKSSVYSQRNYINIILNSNAFEKKKFKVITKVIKGKFIERLKRIVIKTCNTSCL